MRNLIRLLALFAVAVPLFAQVQYSITPNRGPVAGGTEVTIKGQFGNWPYDVYFGAASVPATRVDDTTLRATAPAHLPGPVAITIFEYDIRLSTNLVYTFEGGAQEAFDAVLLPVFTTPIPGAFGSEFRTDFRARLVKGDRAEIHGLRYPCLVTCIQTGDEPYLLTLPVVDADPSNVEPTGNPGTFLYLPKSEAGRVTMNLRAYDTSRSAENFGTEIPIVRVSDFATGYDDITLIGVPSDARFRNTLRIYAYGSTGTPATVRIADAAGVVLSERPVTLAGQENLFRPGYVELSNFPTGAGVLTVTISVPQSLLSAPIPPPDRWAFISVTNNETQHITLITPQP
ncbi:MAG TPA: IPT/TIG domain-containing protein [Thermoanaerobaculia bacterium]